MNTTPLDSRHRELDRDDHHQALDSVYVALTTATATADRPRLHDRLALRLGLWLLLRGAHRRRDAPSRETLLRLRANAADRHDRELSHSRSAASLRRW